MNKRLTFSICGKNFHGVSFKSKRMETSYKEFQKEAEQNLINFISVLSALFMFGDFVLKLLSGSDILIIMSRIMVCAAFTISFVCRKRWPTFQRFSLVIACGSGIYVAVGAFADYFAEISVEGSFLIGNMTGLLEMTIVLAFKNVRFRSLTYLIMMSVKVISLHEEFHSRPISSSFMFITTLIVIMFYVYKDMLDRRKFRLIYEYGEKLKKFEDLLSNGFPSCVVIISSKLNSLLYCNSLFKENFMSGLGEPDKQNGDIKEIFEKFLIQSDSNNKDLREPFSEYLQNIADDQSFQMQENEITTLLTLYTDEKKQSYYEIKLRRVVWEELQSYAITLNDVSDKQMVIGLKMADEQKDKVIATVSHELRTPINGIIGLLEMIATRIEHDEESTTYLDYCKSCSKLLLFLVNSILDLSQIRNNTLSLNREWIDLDDMLEEVRALYIFQTRKKGIQFLIEKEQDVPSKIFTDKYRLIQILVNLLGNAMKFTFKGSITLKILNDTTENSQKLVFVVQDTGIGIEENDQPKLFKMFGKLEQKSKNVNSHGVGLGLTISNELVKFLNCEGAQDKNDEKIEFESEYGKGSKFWFRIDLSPALQQTQEINEPTYEDCTNLLSYEQRQESSEFLQMKVKRYTNFLSIKGPIYNKLEPIKEDDIVYEEEPQKLAPSRQLMNKLVLIVDDNPFNLMTAAFIMEKLGYKIQQAFSGRECIEMLEKSVRSGQKYNLILTDIQMPILDGLEMSKEIQLKIQKKDIYAVPIVAVTAHSINKEEENKYLSYGINFVIQKPLILDVVSEKLKCLFDDV